MADPMDRPEDEDYGREGGGRGVPPLGTLLSIPIVVDEGLPPGTWLLVDTINGNVRQQGCVETEDGRG